MFTFRCHIMLNLSSNFALLRVVRWCAAGFFGHIRRVDAYKLDEGAVLLPRHSLCTPLILLGVTHV